MPLNTLIFFAFKFYFARKSALVIQFRKYCRRKIGFGCKNSGGAGFSAAVEGFHEGFGDVAAMGQEGTDARQLLKLRRLRLPPALPRPWPSCRLWPPPQTRFLKCGVGIYWGGLRGLRVGLLLVQSRETSLWLFDWAGSLYLKWWPPWNWYWRLSGGATRRQVSLPGRRDLVISIYGTTDRLAGEDTHGVGDGGRIVVLVIHISIHF